MTFAASTSIERGEGGGIAFERCAIRLKQFPDDYVCWARVEKSAGQAAQFVSNTGASTAHGAGAAFLAML